MKQCNLTEYQLEINDTKHKFQILLKHKLYYTGRVEGELKLPNEIHLKKIEIFEKPIYTSNILRKILQKVLNFSTPNYRGRGLGSILLIALIEYAYGQRVKYIWGSAKSWGGLDEESLVKWFKRYGFQAQKPTEQNVSGAIAHIQFDF